MPQSNHTNQNNIQDAEVVEEKDAEVVEEQGTLDSLTEAIETEEEWNTTIDYERILKDITDFASGKTGEVPRSLEVLITNVHQKLITVFSSQIVQNATRTQKLFQALRSVEESLLDPTVLATLPHEEKLKLYTALEKAHNNALETQRKFLVQQGDRLKGSLTSVESIAQKLLTLPEDKFKKIVSMVNEVSESSEDKEESTQGVE